MLTAQPKSAAIIRSSRLTAAAPDRAEEDRSPSRALGTPWAPAMAPVLVPKMENITETGLFGDAPCGDTML